MAQDKLGLKVTLSGRKATWLELFYDLIYVIVIAKLAHMMGHVEGGHLDWHHYLVSVGLFVPVWWCWIGHTMFADRFDPDDALHRILTFAQMFGVIMMAISIEGALGESLPQFVLSYIAVRAVLILMYLRVHLANKQTRKVTRLFSVGFSLGVMCWILSLFTPAVYAPMLWGAGLLIDFATPWFGQKSLAQISVHRDHLPERLGLLTIIILGESVLGITMGGMENLISLLSAFVILGCIWWLYFESLEHILAGKELRSGQLSIYGHLPLYIGLATLSAGILHAVKGDISPDEVIMLLCGGILFVMIPLHVFEFTQKTGAGRRAFIARILVFYLLAGGLGVFGRSYFVPSLAVFLVLFVISEQRRCKAG